MLNYLWASWCAMHILNLSYALAESASCFTHVIIFNKSSISAHPTQ